MGYGSPLVLTGMWITMNGDSLKEQANITTRLS